MQTRSGRILGCSRIMSRIIRVPWYLSARCGVWTQDQLVGLRGQVEVLVEDGGLVAGVLVQADLADPQNIRLVQKLGDHGDDLARERDVFPPPWR